MHRNCRMTNWQGIVISLLFLQVLHAAIDNTGTEFIIGYMDNYQTPNSSNYDLELFVTTSSNNEAFINVTLPLYNASWIAQTSVTRGDVSTILLPAEIRGSGTSKGDLGVYITSTEEVTIYSVNKQLYSTDAFTAYPVDSLGSEYVAVTWTNLAQIMVVAVKEETNVDITFPSTYNTTDVFYNGVLYDANMTLTVRLNRFETFHIRSWYGDLTGTRITATSNIAAFSGAYKVAVADSPNTEATSDHLVEQLMPTQAWGREFITFPSPERTLGDYLRVAAAEDNTTYQFDGGSYFLNAQEFATHRVFSDTYYYITSDKGISVMLFSKNIGVTGFNDGPNGGDPAMSVVVPIPLYGYDYTWSTVHTTEGEFTSNFIIVVTRHEYVSGLVLDDMPISEEIMWTNVTGNNDYVGARVSVSDGAHSIYNIDPANPFFGIAYGNALFNSYAYASGLRLTSINLPCNVTSTTAGDGEDNDCDGMIDEETDNGEDDDGDGQVDEDLASGPRVDGSWGTWGSWGLCSTTCGNLTGSYTRSRSCDQPEPANNGLYCPGNATETDVCTGNATACPGTDGEWSSWNAWSSCSVTCGSGTQSRDRACDNPAPDNGGLNCTGDNEESQNCTISDYCLPSFYGNLLLGCTNASFGCATGTVQCIDIEFRCDGTVDCDDGTDENEYFAGCDGTVCSNRNSADMVVTRTMLPSILAALSLIYTFLK